MTGATVVGFVIWVEVELTALTFVEDSVVVPGGAFETADW